MAGPEKPFEIEGIPWPEPSKPSSPPIVRLPEVPKKARPAPVYRPRPGEQDRVPVFNGEAVNLNGFYEAVPQPGQHSGFSLQVNQAGKVLVGWISPTMKSVSPVTSLKTADWPYKPSGPNERNLPSRIGYGVFVLDLGSSEKKSKSAWIKFDWYESRDFSKSFNTFDPQIWGRQEGIRHDGILKLERVRDPEFQYLGVQIRSLGLAEWTWAITGINFSGEARRGFDPVRLVRRKLRLPYEIIKRVEVVPFGSTTAEGAQRKRDMLQEMLIASHISILPESYVLSLLRRTTKLYLEGPFGRQSDQPPATEGALDRWLAAKDKFARRIARDSVIRVLRGMAKDINNLHYAYHREMVRDLFVTNTRLTKKSGRSYYELYVQILDEELSDRGEQAENYLGPIFEMGAFPMISKNNQSFRYTLTFTPVPLLALRDYAKALPVNAGVAVLDVKRELVEFELDEEGRKKIDAISGNPVVKQVVESHRGYDTAKGGAAPVKLYTVGGAFGILPTTVPAHAELYTHVGDIKYEDFADGEYSFVWIQGMPNQNIGPYVKVKPITTGFFELKLPKKNNMGLWGSITELSGFEFTLPKTLRKSAQAVTRAPKSAQDLKNLKDQYNQARGYHQDIKQKGMHGAAEGWLDSLRLRNLKFNFKELLSITMGTGTIKTPQAFRTSHKQHPEEPDHSIEDTRILASPAIRNFFERDSSDISVIVQSVERGGIQRFLTTRLLLEAYLAENLALVMNSDATMTIHGYASPEGPAGPLPPNVDDPHNFELSIQRADAVAQAVMDAMRLYPSTSWAKFDIDAFGELTARELKTNGGGGLADPPSTKDVARFRAWVLNKVNRPQVEEWPRWRRVDVQVVGVQLLRLYDQDPFVQWLR